MAKTASDVAYEQSQIEEIAKGVDLSTLAHVTYQLNRRQAAAKMAIERPNERDKFLAIIEGINRGIEQEFNLNLK